MRPKSRNNGQDAVSTATNRADARSRLVALLRDAAVAPRFRVKTKPSKAAKERRLKEKGTRGAIKRLRRERPGHE